MKKTLLVAFVAFGLMFGGNALFANCGKCGSTGEKKSCSHEAKAGCKHGDSAMGLFKSLKEDLAAWDKQIGDAGFQKGVTEHVKALVSAHADCKKECAAKKAEEKASCTTAQKKQCTKEEKAACSHKAAEEKAACSHKADEKCATEKAGCPDKKKMERALNRLENMAPKMEASFANARLQSKVRKNLDAVVACFDTCMKACSTEKASADKKGCCPKGSEKPAGGCSGHAKS